MLSIRNHLINESRLLIRDPLLKWLIFFPFLIALIYRFFIPELQVILNEKWNFNLAEYSILLLSFVPAMIPSIIGIVVGFNLLDMKDDSSLFALLVTPLSLNQYLMIKLLWPMLLCFPLNLICIWLCSLIDLSTSQFIIASISPIPLAVIFPLLLFNIANNKVEGFALSKIINAFLFPPVLAWFYPSHWNWLFGILPTWWPMKAFWVSIDNLHIAIIICFIGYAVQIAWILILWNSMKKKILI